MSNVSATVSVEYEQGNLDSYDGFTIILHISNEKNDIGEDVEEMNKIIDELSELHDIVLDHDKSVNLLVEDMENAKA